MNPDAPAGPYSTAFLDHFMHPRRQGVVGAPTHRGQADDSACGDRLTLDLVVDRGIVVDARFRVEGCPAAIAIGSALASLAIGRRADVDSIHSDEIESMLDGVPPGKRHALRLGIETWKSALRTPVP